MFIFLCVTSVGMQICIGKIYAVLRVFTAHYFPASILPMQYSTIQEALPTYVVPGDNVDFVVSDDISNLSCFRPTSAPW